MLQYKIISHWIWQHILLITLYFHNLKMCSINNFSQDHSSCIICGKFYLNVAQNKTGSSFISRAKIFHMLRIVKVLQIKLLHFHIYHLSFNTYVSMLGGMVKIMIVQLKNVTMIKCPIESKDKEQ